MATWTSLVDRQPLALEPRLALVEAHLASGRLDEARADVEELPGAEGALQATPSDRPAEHRVGLRLPVTRSGEREQGHGGAVEGLRVRLDIRRPIV